MHTDTKAKIIRRSLLVHADEKADALLLAENERIIRGLPYIMDARFLIRPVAGTDSIDLELLVKDLWPIGFGGEILDLDVGNAGIWHVNTLGVGHQLRFTSYWNAERKPLFGYDVSYGISNLYGSFITARLEHVHKWHTQTYAARLVRRFQTSGLKYAGAFRFENTSARKDIELMDTTLTSTDLQYTLTDLWFGRMFTLPSWEHGAMSSGFYLTGRAFFAKFKAGPEANSTYLYPYQDKIQLLFSLAYSRQGFRKDNQIYTFDRTEDVPFGYLFEATSGVEWSQFRTRPYLAGSISGGNYLHRFGYLFGQLQYGTFFSQGISEQGLLNVRFRYFTPLYQSRRFEFRQFVTFNYQHLMNRYDGEYISLENRNGITGLNSPVMRGDEKIVLNLESVLFSPYHLLGFRFVFFASTDFGLIWKNNTMVTGRNFFNGLGLGVRIRNDELVFDTFEIKFTFYPKLPEDAETRYLEAGSVPSLRLIDFYPGRPSVLNY